MWVETKSVNIKDKSNIQLFEEEWLKIDDFLPYSNISEEEIMKSSSTALVITSHKTQ